jgi:glyoxylate carboligase
MVAQASSAAMTTLIGATTLPHHIVAPGCRTNSVRCSTVSHTASVLAPPATLLGFWGCTNPCKGGNIFLELLERGGANAAFAYTSGTFMERVGVCIITSWSDATNIVAALLDSTPMVTITGQVPHRISGTDAFQMSVTEVTHSITKHSYLIFDVDDIPRVIH